MAAYETHLNNFATEIQVNRTLTTQQILTIAADKIQEINEQSRIKTGEPIIEEHPESKDWELIFKQLCQNMQEVDIIERQKMRQRPTKKTDTVNQ